MRKYLSKKLIKVAALTIVLFTSATIFFYLEKDPELENLEISAEVISPNIGDLKQLIINLDLENKFRVTYSALLMPVI